MQITIPDKFQKCLAADPKWKRRTETLTDALSGVLSQATDFFPEYTDHGVDHVNTVLELAAKLISGDPLSARDAACLVAAIAIHDLGMFLTPAGLNMLMTNRWDSHRNETLDQYSWAEAWERYLSETKRLPQERMLRCFGRMIEVEKTTLVKEDMTWDDKLVIGEFLRRNHPRLAQEIAQAGFPGSTVQHFLEDAGFEEDERGIIGLAARSHGMSLRQMEEYLGPDGYDSNVPVYYLMSILRMADLLDTSEDRAPMIRIRQEDLGSPLSREEWALNRCFRISSSRWYPESRNYTITANPQTSSEYARVEKWLEQAQRELDLCWAALAEKYPDSALKLSIHRVKCTMHEKRRHREIADRILPREVKVTANPEIVKLMIEPLYGDDPTYGVRELLQNAVDACVERKEWERRHGNPNYKGLVDIRVEGDTFTITDNGMGMNEDILLNYYLSAGSSYRNSEAWKAANAPDGESQVARTGKFGVGFLASFLLGDEIEVHTQHREDKKGYQFKFDQRSMPLDVERKVRSNPYATAEGDCAGTTIMIKLKDIALNNWYSRPLWNNWYAFDEPKVRYTMNGVEQFYKGVSLCRDPSKNPEWLRYPTKDYDNFLWHPNLSGYTPKLYCNGILIQSGIPQNLESHRFPFSIPHISIIDKKARLDVDLSRKVLKSLSESESLKQEVLRYHIARLLLTPWDTESDHFNNYALGFPLSSPSHSSCSVSFILSQKGFQLNHTAFFTSMGIDSYVILCPDTRFSNTSIGQLNIFLKQDIPYSIHYPSSLMPYASDAVIQKEAWNLIISCLESHKRIYSTTKSYWGNDGWLSVWLQNKLAASSHTNEAYSLIGKIGRQADGIQWLRKGFAYTPSPILFEQIPKNTILAAIHISPNTYDYYKQYCSPNALFTLVLQETLSPSPDYPDQDLWIPFDMEERKKKFPKAFEELKVYMDHIKKYPVD